MVAKFYRPGRWSEAQILEEHAFAAELMAAEVPVVAPLVLQGQHAAPTSAASPSASARAAAAARPSSTTRRCWSGSAASWPACTWWARAALSRTRPALDLHTFGLEPRDWLLEHDMIPLDVQSEWQSVATRRSRMISDTALGERRDSGIAMLRLHGDCHPGNILWTPGRRGPHFVDLDDARTGPAVQDLWMLLSGDRAQRQRQLGALVDGYELFREFDRAELALIEPLRTLRLIHYSAWLARRWDDPIFPITSRGSAPATTGRARCRCCDEQIEAMEEAPLVV